MMNGAKDMRKSIRLALVWLAAGCAGSAAHAQDLVITNARLLDGAGTDISNGTIVVQGGRIAEVKAGGAPEAAGNVIDAHGMTLLPGYIDAHRHIIRGNADEWLRTQAAARMQEFLDAGYTTLMSGGDPVPAIFELKRRIDSGELMGPRIITSGRVDPPNFPTEAQARAEVRRLAGLGVEIIKVRMDTVEQKALITTIVDEAKRHNLDVMIHASASPEVMIAAVETGAGKLVHTPHGGFITDEQARRVAEAGIENLTTAGFAVPTFDVFNDDNVPTFRDGSPWPDGILQGGRPAAAQKVVNARILWDNGVTLGFGTDTSYLPIKGLKHELRTLNLMFSERDIIKLMGPNTAAFLEMQDEIGSLAVGSRADLVLVGGDPLESISNLLNVAMVVKDGKVVVDRMTREMTWNSLPDWSGVWAMEGPTIFDRATQEGQGGSVTPGVRERPPYNEEWEAKYQRNLALRDENRLPDPITNCGLPVGFPRIMNMPDVYEFAVTPEQVWIIAENGPNVLRIYTDGRDHPPPEERWGTYTGDSVGHWEGDTLVFDTVSLMASEEGPTIIDRTGLILSDAAHVVTRMRKIDDTTIEAVMTIEDEKALTRPWIVTKRYKRQPDGTRAYDYACNQNNRNPVNPVTGQTLTIGPNGEILDRNVERRIVED
ncbi:MAG: amidohydrolase family protein [Gammaproteobacteria bacterium]